MRQATDVGHFQAHSFGQLPTDREIEGVGIRSLDLVIQSPEDTESRTRRGRRIRESSLRCGWFEWSDAVEQSLRNFGQAGQARSVDRRGKDGICEVGGKSKRAVGVESREKAGADVIEGDAEAPADDGL